MDAYCVCATDFDLVNGRFLLEERAVIEATNDKEAIDIASAMFGRRMPGARRVWRAMKQKAPDEMQKAKNVNAVASIVGSRMLKDGSTLLT